MGNNLNVNAHAGEFDIRHEPQHSRFALYRDGEVVAIADYDEHDGIRDFNHTEVEKRHRGQGLSTPLIAYALATTRSQGFDIKPSCTAIAHYIAKNPKY
ncbi:MAG: GNAT family N-acetyltransferase [Corynebacterium sp.]|uniref:GNAT family N-acetyltransferase n=1 Tax=Corynebacterium sp. TaxID=1720 RepID=UPI0026DBD873|nr:GNAT family N-acetyltransferase [Corynebacterium sp.]MDO4762742.1 GNAT family N-acetyltransferase [Corynebacterium sp.]